MSIDVSPDMLEARKRLVDEHIRAEVVHDLDAIMRTWGESPVLEDVAWLETSAGADEIRAHYKEVLEVFPDLDIAVHQHYMSSDAIVVELTILGTHLGQWRDLPPLGRRMEVRGLVLYKFDDNGLMQLERTFYDRALMLEQLGMFHDPRTGAGRAMAVLTPPFTVVRAFVRNLFRRHK